MRTLSKTLSVVALSLADFVVQAEDFSSLMQVTKSTWPERTHIGVICDFRYSKAQVEDLARAAGPGSTITVADIRTRERGAVGARMVAQRQAHFLVLLPKDPLFGDGSSGATLAIKCLATFGIPTIGTTPRALAQGAVFCMGDGTNGEVLVTNRLQGTVDVTLPAGINSSQKGSLSLGEGWASIMVYGAK